VLRRPTIALLLAAVCLAGLAATGVLAYLVPVAHQGDAATLRGFMQLAAPDRASVLDHIAHLADPAPYALAGIALMLVALARRRARVALAIPPLLMLTGATTEILKHLLASPRYDEWLGHGQINAVSWPSGHATAAMTLALAAIIASPPRARPTVAVIGGAFAVAVAWAILVLGWHFPSDVLGGFLVAGFWTSLAVAAVAAADRRRPAARVREAPMRRVDAIPAVGLAALALGVAIAAFVVGAAAIAALGVATPVAVTGAATRPDPTAARRPRWRRG
jgi:membrane-associated phospholipid phosphatase